ncbi:hypothetical protein N7478_007594 [Penicillium angulare]|uniref:uncharacterized protein n=1 Tax=Penicillium angulare TaxID=116970 RepID=UPI002541F4A9|nr:uncharacterized protein N7478_007594 [Penicillium angulare]KAJ5272469.1 hypothetical protein N7478_007594 [Penicillium angulare]
MEKTNNNPTPFLGRLKHKSVADCIGATPLVRLNHLPTALGIKAQVFPNLEYLNPGGSVKDRIVKPSSGNTGIAIALMAAIKGYKCIITLSEKMSLEKEQILKVLGARVIRTPAGVSIDSPDSIISVAKPHEYETAEELWYQTEGHIDSFISAGGTGGTVNEVLDQYGPDLWIKTSDADSFNYARRLVREEGILCGGSSGATIAALAQLVKSHRELNVEDKVIVGILADSLRNYLTKFANNGWMAEQGYSVV